MADQNELSRYLAKVHANVFEQTNIDRVCQVGMKIEQDIDTRFAHGPDVSQYFGWLRIA